MRQVPPTLESMWRSIGSWFGYLLVAAVILGAAGLAGTLLAGRLIPDSAFRITSFDGEYVLEPQPDGSLDALVTERIATDFRAEDKRGIIRTIPLRYQDHSNAVTEIEVTGQVTTRTWPSGSSVPPHEVERATARSPSGSATPRAGSAPGSSSTRSATGSATSR